MITTRKIEVPNVGPMIETTYSENMSNAVAVIHLEYDKGFVPAAPRTGSFVQAAIVSGTFSIGFLLGLMFGIQWG